MYLVRIHQLIWWSSSHRRVTESTVEKLEKKISFYLSVYIVPYLNITLAVLSSYLKKVLQMRAVLSFSYVWRA